MQPRHKILGRAEPFHRHLAHPRHYPHARHYIRAVRGLHTDLAERRIRRPHDVWHHVHGPPAHRPVQQRPHLVLRRSGVHPVVGRPGILFFRRADERQVLRPGHVVHAASVQVTVRIGLFVQPLRIAGPQHLFQNPLVLRLRPVAKHDVLRFRQPCCLIHPIFYGIATPPPAASPPEFRPSPPPTPPKTPFAPVSSALLPPSPNFPMELPPAPPAR